MLAGPPPTSFNTSPTLPTVQPQSQFGSSMLPNQYRPPIPPLNFQGVPLSRPPSQPPLPAQPPMLPPNFPVHRHHSSVAPTSGAPGNQEQFTSQPPIMPNGINQHSNKYLVLQQGSHGVTTPTGSFQPIHDGTFPNSLPSTSQYQPSLPPTMNNMSAYNQGSLPGNQPVYSGQPSATMSNNQFMPNSYPSQPQYPNPSGLSGPVGNRSDSYQGQATSSSPTPQPFPSSRIDPDIVPNVVQVLEQSQEKITEPFITNAPGLLPPLAGLNFICHDQGSCNPRLMRSTVYAIPNSMDMVKQSQIPIALSISPLANLRPEELEPPLTNFGDLGPVRCQRCKAYMCPFMKFIDGGKRFVCCFCEAATDVPSEYFSHLDHSGRRTDCYQRAELCLGAYEISATKQYCKGEKFPDPPAFIFMIDVSYNSIRSGLVHHLCRMLRDDLLDFLPKEKDSEISKIRIGFATFDKQIHFYNIKGNTLGQPQMMIVSDLEDIFVPLLNGFLCSAYESRAVINSLLERIPQTFANCQESETILAPVIQSGIQALKMANCSGKIYIFSSALPSAAAPGKLINRDEKKLLGTEKEKLLLTAANETYTKLGEECAEYGCAVDLFAFSNNYLDLATIGEVCRVSGGEIYKFDHFSIETDGERLYDALKRNFQRPTVFDALMRIRTSAGIRPVDFLGNFYMTNTTEIVFGTVDADKSISVELKHDDKLPVDSQVYTQVALLHTTISGQRCLRILTLALTTTSSYSSLYLSCDLDTILNYIVKIALRSITVSTAKSIRENIITQVAHMLACYRKQCAQSTAAGQLILPDTMKLLPVYIASLIKCDALIGSQISNTDDRSWLLHRLMSMNVQNTSAYLYPRIYPLHTLNENNIPPSMIRCLSERLLDIGAYVIENGIVMYIWIGSRVDSTFVQDLFGQHTAAQTQLGKYRIVENDNRTSTFVRTLLSMIRSERNSYMKFNVLHQRDPMEPLFKNYLVEDKGLTSGASYVDFLYQLHREIRNILS